jgi:hypothetical protein
MATPRPLPGVLVVLSLITGACALGSAAPIRPDDVPKKRLELIRRAQVWKPTKIAAMEIKTGPTGRGAFRAGQTVTCDYVKEKLSGKTPKFQCALSKDDAVKVKYGETNGEVYSEVAASRLLWALGFPADAQYPVRVVCRGCPADPSKTGDPEPGERIFEYAAIERKYPGKELTVSGEGWAWPELDLVDPEAGGAPRAHRDALKLLAVLLQHTDSKPEQQRLVCSDDVASADKAACPTPIMMINDLGLTFGRANNLNTSTTGSTNFQAWSDVKLWKEPDRCVSRLSKSLTGTLEDPAISEAGRYFLASLLSQLSDAQLRDLFEVARVSDRKVKEDGVRQAATVDAWVQAFKDKRLQIVGHTCQGT